MVESKSKQYSKRAQKKDSTIKGRIIVNKGTLLRTKQLQHKLKNSGGKVLYSSRALKSNATNKSAKSDNSSLSEKKENKHLTRNKYTLIHQADLLAKDIINSQEERPLGLQAVGGMLDSVDYVKTGVHTIRRGIKVIKNANRVIRESRNIDANEPVLDTEHAAPSIKYKHYTKLPQLNKKLLGETKPQIALLDTVRNKRVYYKRNEIHRYSKQSVQHRYIYHSATANYKKRTKQSNKKLNNSISHKPVQKVTTFKSFPKVRQASSAHYHDAVRSYSKRVKSSNDNNKILTTNRKHKNLTFSNKLKKGRISYIYRIPEFINLAQNDKLKNYNSHNIYKEIKGAKVNTHYIIKIKASPIINLKMGVVANNNTGSFEKKSKKINKKYVAKSFAKWSVKIAGHTTVRAAVNLKESTFKQLRHEDVDMGVRSIAEAEENLRKSRATAITVKNTGKRIHSGIKTAFNVAEKLSGGRTIRHERIIKEIGQEHYRYKNSIKTNSRKTSCSKIRTKKVGGVDKNISRQRNKSKLITKVVKVASDKVKNLLVKVLLAKSLSIIGIALLLTIILLIAINSVISLLFGVSWKSEDEYLTETFLYITKLDTNLEFKIYNMENESKYARIKYFDYNFEIEPYTDIEKLMTYLDVKFEDYKLNDVKSLIDKIHSEMYTLSTETTHKKEGHGDDRETVYTLHITLSGFDFDEFIEKHRETEIDNSILNASGDERTALKKFKSEHKYELLSDEQYDMYTTMLELGGDTMRKVLASPFPGEDWYSRVSSRYGYRINPLKEKPEIVVHRALDIPFYQGKVICASMSGKANVIYNHSSYGNYVTIDNGTMRTLYAHCSKILINDGQEVSMGDSIAEVGSTGDSTGPHLHMEYTYKGKNLNPLFYVER